MNEFIMGVPLAMIFLRVGSNLNELYNKELKRKAEEQKHLKEKNLCDVVFGRVQKVHAPANG